MKDWVILQGETAKSKVMSTAFLLDALLTCDLDQTRTQSLDRPKQSQFYANTTSSKKKLNGIPKRMTPPTVSPRPPTTRKKMPKFAQEHFRQPC